MSTSAQSPSCDSVARCYRAWFSAPCLIGLTAFFIYRYESQRFNAFVYKVKWDKNFVSLTTNFDRLTIPRSNFEFGYIGDHLGEEYLMLTVLTWAAISVTAISILIVTLKSGLKGINQNTQTSSNKQMLAALIVVVGALILRPAFEGATSITANKPDLSGIFFLKESLVMSIGYYHLYIILVNIIASMRSR